MKHARLTASAAGRWMACPGSVREADKHPNITSAEAAYGTFGHHIAAACLEEGRLPAEWLGNRTLVDGVEAECDVEMIEAVQDYLDDCAADKMPGDQEWIEVSLWSALQKIDKDLGGTADRIRWRPATANLLVHDLKLGAGVMVDPEDNKQLKTYALGALLKTGVAADDVEVRITQPRIPHAAGTSRSWTFKGIDLVAFGREMQVAAEKTRDEHAALIPGRHCRQYFCPAAAHCPAVNTMAVALVGADDFAVDQPYDKAKLLQGLGMIGPLKQKIKAMEELAYHEATAGRITPEDGWKLVEKRKTRKWNDEPAVAGWAESHGVDAYVRELRSPAQLEKLAKDSKVAKADRDELGAFITAESSGTVLVPVSDERPEFKRLTSNDFATPDQPAKVTEVKVLNLFV